VEQMLDVETLPSPKMDNERENQLFIKAFVYNVAEMLFKAGASIRETQDIIIEYKDLIHSYSAEIWTNKLSNYPEFVMSMWINEKGVLKSSISLPKVVEEFLGRESLSDYVKEKILPILL
jgi:hypothetical protein